MCVDQFCHFDPDSDVTKHCRELVWLTHPAAAEAALPSIEICREHTTAIFIYSNTNPPAEVHTCSHPPPRPHHLTTINENEQSDKEIYLFKLNIISY